MQLVWFFFFLVFFFFFMVSWAGSPRIIHIPFSWLGGSSAQNHDFRPHFIFAVHVILKRIVIDHFRIMDSGLASWELQEYLWCVLFLVGSGFPR